MSELKTFGGLRVVSARNRTPFLKFMVYGDSGIGKTTLLGSADDSPLMRPALFIDVEGGTESLREAYPDVDIVRVTSWGEMQKVYNQLRQTDHGYRTVGLDSLTEIQKLNMYYIMEDLLQRKGDDSKVDPDVPSMREWGKNLEQVRKMVRFFRDLRMHVIFSALAKTDKDNQTGAIKYGPSLSGKMAQEVAAFLDVVGYYYAKTVTVDGKEENRRYLLTQPTERHVAKDRTGKLPLTIQNPTMDKIINIIYKEQSSGT